MGVALGPERIGTVFCMVETKSVSNKPAKPVTPAQAGVQESSKNLDSGLRRNDEGTLDYGFLDTL